MNDSDVLHGSVIADHEITLDHLARLCAVSQDWVLQRIDAGVLSARGGASSGWRFSSRTVWRVRRMVALERDFDAAPELAALAADLMEELERARAHLRHAGLADR